MGYESKLYVVEKHHTLSRKINGKDMLFGEVVAVFNLCKVYDVSGRVKSYKDTDAYIYADNDDDKIVVDRYGDPLKEIPLSDMIDILEEAAANDSYRRYGPCIAYLKAIDPIEWEDIVVLHYGH